MRARKFFGNALRSILLALVAIAQAAYGQSVKIMPMGDSLTSGYRQYVSYRYDLWFDLLDAGFDVDFVGSAITTEGSPNLDWYPQYLTTFDRDHDGYSGYRSDQLAEIARLVSARHQPDIVLLWAGVNDIWAYGAGRAPQ
jgi:lysophospholipase L1-like esterase